MRGQRGQSMAEYLVVLGVSGSIIAGLTLLPCTEANSAKGCIPTMLDALHNNYEGYSAAVSDIQDYGDVKVAAPPADEGGGGDGDNDEIPGGGDDDGGTAQAESLGKVNQLYDANGNLLGTVQGTQIYDLDGKLIGDYNFDPVTGEQTAVIDGKPVTGVNVVGVIIGKDGDPLAIKAFMVNGQVVGFGYADDGKYYDALQGTQIVKVPNGVSAVDTRAVKIRDGQGKVSDFGYEVGGYIYSLAKVQVANETYTMAKVADAELVEMRLTETSTIASWDGYSKCVARSLDWVDSELNGDLDFDKSEDDGSGNQVTTTGNAVVESPTNNVGFIDSADLGSGCQGRWVVQEKTDSWSVSGPYTP